MDFQLHKMTVQEKLRLMEAPWADLTRNADEYESPAWHEEELKKREKEIAEGRGFAGRPRPYSLLQLGHAHVFQPG